MATSHFFLIKVPRDLRVAIIGGSLIKLGRTLHEFKLVTKKYLKPSLPDIIKQDNL